MFKAIIFDFNGVIVDDEPLHLELFRVILAEEGIPLTDEEYQAKYLGYDDRGCFQSVLRDVGREAESRDENRIAALIDRKAALYIDAIEQRYLLFPGVVELVEGLAEQYPLAIASGALRNEIEAVLDRGGIRKFFQEIIAAEDVSACKPDPEGYIKALALLNQRASGAIPAADCLVIEDSVAGIEAAKRAGMRCLAVTNSYPAEKLSQADRIVATLANCNPAALF